MAQTETKPGARATVRYLHTSPYKVRQVLELIRGLPVEDADRMLQLCEKDAADDIAKLLTSAAANAEHNNEIPADELFVARAWADEGPTRKWGQARARGRYFRIRHRTSHVTIVLERFDTEELEEKRRRDESTGRGAAGQQRRRAERVRKSRAAQGEEAAEETAEEEIEEVEAVEEVETVEAVDETEAPEASDDDDAEDVDGDEAEEGEK
jgi:large subunit ribosomal protein L22